MSESSIQKRVMAAIGARDGVLVWRQQSGAFRALNDPKRIVKVGTPGISDALAVVGVKVTPEMVGKRIGVAVGIEFKSEKGRQSDAQAAWQKAFEGCGGTYAIVRSVEDAVELIKRLEEIVAQGKEHRLK